MKQRAFSRKEHLKESGLIYKVLKEGLCFKGTLINVFLLENPHTSKTKKVAFISRRRLHRKKSVIRNRIKRVLREAYRRTKHLLPGSYDIVIFATGVTPRTSSADIEREIACVFKEVRNKHYRVLS